MELTTVEELIAYLKTKPSGTKIYVGGTTGYVHEVVDDEYNEALSFDDAEEVYF